MKNLFLIIIGIALAYGYMNNKAKVHELIGLDSPSESSENNTNNKSSKVDGINYTKLENLDRLNVGVHLISASWCGYCKKLRNLMTEQGIEFTEYNVEDDALVDEFLQKNNVEGGVPVTVIGGDIVYGYDVAKLEKAFKQNNIDISGI